MTDFVGWLPMPDGGEHEAYLTADYNAEMVEHIAGHPDLRDRAIFVGNPEDIVDERLGPAAADDPRLDRAQLRVRRLRHRASTRAASATATNCATTLGYRPGREGLHRQRRRIRGGRAPAAPRHRVLRRRQAAGARAAHDRGGRTAHRPGVPAAARRVSRSSPTSTTSTAISRRATSRWCRVASRPRWSSRRAGGRFSTSRCATTSSRTCTWRTGSTATAPAAGWTSTPRRPT